MLHESAPCPHCRLCCCLTTERHSAAGEGLSRPVWRLQTPALIPPPDGGRRCARRTNGVFQWRPRTAAGRAPLYRPGPAAAGWAGRGRRGLSDLRPGIPSRVWSRWCSPPQPHWHVHVSAGIYMISFSLPTNNLKIKHLAYLFTVYRQNLIFLEFFAKLSVDTFDIAKITFSLMLYHLLFQKQIHFHKKKFLKSKKTSLKSLRLRKLLD